MRKTKYYSTCLQCICCDKKKITKGLALFSIQYLQTRELDIKGTTYEYTYLNGQLIPQCRITHKPQPPISLQDYYNHHFEGMTLLSVSSCGENV